MGGNGSRGASLKWAAVGLLLALAGGVALAGGKIQTDKEAPPLPREGVARVLLLPPEVAYESQATEQRLDPAPYRGEQVSAAIAEKSRHYLLERGFSLETPDGGKYPAPSILARKTPLPADICAGTPAAGSGIPVLAIHARVIVGAHGTWNPNTGAITAAGHHTRLRAALVDCRTARVLWRNEVVVRQIPEPESTKLEKAIGLLLGVEGKPVVKEKNP